MKYKVKEPLLFGGKRYGIDSVIEIAESDLYRFEGKKLIEPMPDVVYEHSSEEVISDISEEPAIAEEPKKSSRKSKTND